MKNFKIFIWIFGILVIANPSCKCKKEEPPTCAPCGVNEECVDLQCQCKPNASRYLGSCIRAPLVGPDSTNAYLMYVSKEACLSFDTTAIFFVANHLVNVPEYSGITPIGSDWIHILKLYNYNATTEHSSFNPGRPDGYTSSRSAMFYRQNGVVKLNFILMVSDILKPFFYKPPGHDKHPFYYQTHWNGVFSDDLKTINFKVYLKEHEDATQWWTKTVDSCNMIYERW